MSNLLNKVLNDENGWDNQINEDFAHASSFLKNASIASNDIVVRQNDIENRTLKN